MIGTIDYKKFLEVLFVIPCCLDGFDYCVTSSTLTDDDKLQTTINRLNTET